MTDLRDPLPMKVSEALAILSMAERGIATGDWKAVVLAAQKRLSEFGGTTPESFGMRNRIAGIEAHEYIRITTRRARACNPTLATAPGDIEIAQTDQGELDKFAKLWNVAVVCTIVDIGDPRFRLWLVNTLRPKLAQPDCGLVIHVISSPGGTDIE